jgi:hypothetical protein
MSISRYQRERERIAGPKFTRGVVKLYLVGAAIGLILGVIAVIVGILRYHPLW